MSTINQFESKFKAASKEVFKRTEIEINKVLFLCDDGVEVHAKELLEEVTNNRLVEFVDCEFSNLQEMLDCIERIKPDLIVSNRHLRSDNWQWDYSLGEYIDVLSQSVNTPILLMPHPKKTEMKDFKTEKVMLITEDLTGEDYLVNLSTTFTKEKGDLYLTHLEDSEKYNHYMEVISKIEEIDTDSAAKLIKERLLKEPKEYIKSVTVDKDIKVNALVSMGTHLQEYKKWIEDHKIDLLILKTKDEKQVAMKSEAYPLVVELIHTPLLLA